MKIVTKTVLRVGFEVFWEKGVIQGFEDGIQNTSTQAQIGIVINVNSKSEIYSYRAE